MVTVAKAARHSDPRLTLKVYAHVGLEELGNAVDLLPAPGTCTQEQVMNDIPQGGIKNLPPYLPLGGGNSGHFEAHNSTFPRFEEHNENAQKTAKKTINTGEKDGAGHGVRTRDIQLGKLAWGGCFAQCLQ